MIQFRYSKDGGENWSNWRDLASGDTGSFQHPLIVRRLGRAEHFVVQYRDTSDTAQDVLSASIDIQPE